MNEMKDVLTLTLKLKRNKNGTVGMSHNMKGEGFHFFEVIGLIECAKKQLIDRSLSTAEEIPKDGKVRLKFK